MEKWRGEKEPKSAHPRIQPFVKLSMWAKSGKREEETFKESLGVLSEEANSLQSAEESRVLAGWAGPNSTGRDSKSGPDGDGSKLVQWGTAFPTDEYIIASLRMGNLIFCCIDFGETPKLSTALNQKLRIGGDVETQKCTSIALSDGVEWDRKANQNAVQRDDVLTCWRVIFAPKSFRAQNTIANKR